MWGGWLGWMTPRPSGRYPFLLVDRVLEYKEFEYLVAIKNVSMNEPFFNGHFPGEPIMPGVLNMSCTGVVGMAMECALPFSISRDVRSYGECGSTRHIRSHIRKAPHPMKRKRLSRKRPVRTAVRLDGRPDGRLIRKLRIAYGSGASYGISTNY